MADFVSEQQLNRNFALLKAIPLIKKILREIWIAAVIILWAFVFYQITDIVILQYGSMKDITARLVQIPFQPKRAPQFLTALQVLDVGAVKGEGGGYDLYARVKNTNPNYRADLSRIFQANGATVEAADSFIYPGEEKYVVAVGYASPSGTPQITVDPHSVRWQQVTPQDINLYRDRTRFEVSDVNYTTQATSGSGQGLAISRIQFKLSNKGGTSFWNVRIPIILKNGSQVVAVNERTVGPVEANSSQTVEARWFSNTQSADTYVVQPEVDALNETTIKPPTGQPVPVPSDTNSSPFF